MKKDLIKGLKWNWLFLIGYIASIVMFINSQWSMVWLIFIIYEIIWISWILLTFRYYTLDEDPIIVSIRYTKSLMVDDPFVIDDDDPIIVLDDPVICEVINTETLPYEERVSFDSLFDLLDEYRLKKVCECCGMSNILNSNTCIYCYNESLVIYVH